jgi:hypothetical protein
MMEKVAQGQVFLIVLWLPLLMITPPLLHTYLLQPLEVCNRPDQAAHHHAIGTKLGVSSLAFYFAALEVKEV